MVEFLIFIDQLHTAPGSLGVRRTTAIGRDNNDAPCRDRICDRCVISTTL
jgi:hypothetical protein